MPCSSRTRWRLSASPSRPFDVVCYEVRKTDKLGRVRLESNHIYSVAPELALTEVVCALRAREASIADAEGAALLRERSLQHQRSSEPAGPARQDARRVGHPPGEGRPSGRAARLYGRPGQGRQDGEDQAQAQRVG